jgi:hypothetical protein
VRRSQINSSTLDTPSDLEKTSLFPVMKFFESHFLTPLHKGLRRVARDEADQMEAALGDF